LGPSVNNQVEWAVAESFQAIDCIGIYWQRNAQ